MQKTMTAVQTMRTAARRAAPSVGVEAAFRGLPAMMTLEMAAFELSVSRRTVGRLVRRYRDTKGKFGLGPVYRVGSRPLVPTRAIVAYLDEGLLAEEVAHG